MNGKSKNGPTLKSIKTIMLMFTYTFSCIVSTLLHLTEKPILAIVNKGEKKKNCRVRATKYELRTM